MSHQYIFTFLAFVLSLGCIWLILRLPTKLKALDTPNSRSLHDIPTPRLGGIAILIGIILPLTWLYFIGGIQSDYFAILLAIGLVAGISVVDDFYSISFIIRITIHITAAAIIVNSGHLIENVSTDWGDFVIPVYIALPLSIFFVVWMINLYNFMDGIDGLAGGMAVFGFGTFAIIGYMEAQLDFAISSLVIASSALGFLVWNYPPARIFMGDSGSSSLGLLAAILSLVAHVQGFIPIWVSVIIFSPFIADATVTLINRIIRRERFWDAHKSHYYQLFAESGMSRKKLVNVEYVLMLVCSAIAIFTYNANLMLQMLSMLFLVILYSILMRYAGKTLYNPARITPKEP